MVLYFESGEEQQRAALPDGSLLHLNAHTKLRVDFASESRHIALLQGEARFHVAKNLNRPFCVDSPHARVCALGTTFNVRVSGQDTGVTLLEGHLAVSKHTAYEARPSGTLELEAGQSVRIESSGAMAFGQGRTVDAANAWPQLVVVFKRSKLSEVVDEVNRYRDHPFVIDDARLAEIEITGSVNVFESESYWDLLEKAGYLHIERREDGTTLLAPTGKMLDDKRSQ
jgi:transmembrane sensor